jgi:hypothetical protein
MDLRKEQFLQTMHLRHACELFGIGEAVRHAYQGHLDFHYLPEENLRRVHWKR